MFNINEPLYWDVESKTIENFSLRTYFVEALGHMKGIQGNLQRGLLKGIWRDFNWTYVCFLMCLSVYLGAEIPLWYWHGNLPVNRLTENTTENIIRGGSRIFPRGVRQLPKVLLFFNFFPENCMKIKEFGPPGGASLAPPLRSANDNHPATLLAGSNNINIDYIHHFLELKL